MAEFKIPNLYSFLCRPIQRSSSEVRQLAQHLSHFPELTPDPSPPAAVLEGLASRVLGESLPTGGFACELITTTIQGNPQPNQQSHWEQ